MDTPIVSIDFLSFQKLRQLQAKERIDCHAAFTAIATGEIWPFANFGNTDDEFKDINLRGYFSALDNIADLFLEFLPEGGRFFISKTGAGVTPEKSHLVSQAFALLKIDATSIRVAPPREIP